MLQTVRNAAARAEASIDAAALQPSRVVLVVDDEVSIRITLCRMLRFRGFHAVEATTATDAVRIAKQMPLAAIILDLGLAGCESGLDFLAWLRTQSQHAAAQVLILTGQMQLREEEEAIIRRHGAYVFYKPLSLATLTEYLTRLVPSEATCA